MVRRLVWLPLVLAMALPGGAGAQSLWREGASGASLFTDVRAQGVNDLITILIVEQSSSSRTANTTTSKQSTRTAGVNQFPSAVDPVSRLARDATKTIMPFQTPSQFFQNGFGLDIATNGSHEGKGSIDRTDKVSGTISARVVKVVDGGNLLIEGRRSVLVNNETQVITISGIVRPQDISSSNTVLSTQIADAEVQMEGKGVLAEAQRPGFFYRVLDWLGLF